MNFDFALLLTGLTALAGVIWLIDALLFGKARKAANQQLAEGALPQRDPWLTEQAKSFFPVLVLVLVVRSFWFEPFQIPSPSMVPTLLVGDFLVVNKYAYGLRLPVLNTKILAVGSPERGDVVVFRRPHSDQIPLDQPDEEEGKNYIKRLIGLPGDQIRYENHQLFINDEPMQRTQVSSYVGDIASKVELGTDLLSEQLMDRPHQILNGTNGFMNNQFDGSWTVPAGHYFMMGDNRDGSADSRAWGFVPEANLVGRASFIWFHFDRQRNGIVAWNRIGTKIK
jgi:signal peptidase I